MSILRILGLEGGPGQSAPESETLRKITRALEAMDPEKARYVAAFAFVLGRVANADLSISDVETREMERIVQRWAGLPEEQAILVVQIAKTQSRLFGGTENFPLTKLFKDLSTPQQREELLHCLFAVSASDDSISTVEENEIWKVAAELGITHSAYVAIRADYSQKRQVLKDLPSKN
ncbi:MAG TPA: TerB family tellurite resistance protein [Candidatus Polarisedimenticolia bacterium]|jgi:uncharacterized tellurite resistance protein B-like protein|nr:TerB family tellurite resistance protein [Candidatus Polarisedimenticolia bacterium]